MHSRGRPRRAHLLALASIAALLALGASAPGCGSGERRGRRAGSEPIPSSDPPVSVPASSSAPMFPGVARAPQIGPGDRPGGLIGEIMADEERRRRAEEAASPQRLEDPTAQGRRIALETMAELRGASATGEEGEEEVGDDDNPCVEAWRMRQTRRRTSGRAHRTSFMQRCRALPEEQQRCMSPIYQGQHAQECAEIGEREGRRQTRRAGIDPSTGQVVAPPRRPADRAPTPSPPPPRTDDGTAAP